MRNIREFETVCRVPVEGGPVLKASSDQRPILYKKGAYGVSQFIGYGVCVHILEMFVSSSIKLALRGFAVEPAKLRA